MEETGKDVNGVDKGEPAKYRSRLMVKVYGTCKLIGA